MIYTYSAPQVLHQLPTSIPSPTAPGQRMDIHGRKDARRMAGSGADLEPGVLFLMHETVRLSKVNLTWFFVLVAGRMIQQTLNLEPIFQGCKATALFLKSIPQGPAHRALRM